MKGRAVLCLVAVLRCAAATVALEPCTLRQDFQDDSLGQWASYPPVQDVGYDPSLSPATEYGAPGGRALMRTIRPTSGGSLRFGFIRRLDMVNAGGVRVSFAYRLKGAREGDELEIGLACADGKHHVKRMLAATAGEWAKADIRFDSIAHGAAIQGVYVEADLRQADPDMDYRFLIDHVELHAARAVRFHVSVPATTAIEPWPEPIGAVSYRAGMPISIQASAPTQLARAQCTLRDSNGRQVASRPMRFQDGAWTADALYTPRESDPTGVWTATLSGTERDGDSIGTTVRLLTMPTARPHPRLYFSSGDRAMLETRARQHTELWRRLEELARAARNSGSVAKGGRVTEMLDPIHLLPTLPGYFDVLTRASSRISYNALTGYVDGDPEARAAAKRTLLEAARWSTWTPPWFAAHGQHTYYPVGQFAADAALGYDLLYDDLSTSERTLVRRALLERCVIPTYKEYVLDNRILANTSNWIAHTVGGALIALAVIRGDGDCPQFATYAGGLLRKLEDHMAASYLPDGSYGEGISYQEFDLSTLTLAMTALQRNFGIDYWSRTNVTKSLEYPLYAMTDPIEETQDMGDSHPPSGYSAAGVALHSQDPVTRWYYNQFPHHSILDFLLFPGDALAGAPSIPTSRIFHERGNAIFRTGWKPDDIVFLFRAGPNFNHNHADQGSFLLHALGENFATDAGYADYYKDPYYGSYFSQAAGHNTVLVDGNYESQAVADTRAFPALDSYPRITDVITSDFHDALGSELASVYKGRLERFTRRVVFMKPRYFVIYDDLAARGEPASFDWLLHVTDKSRFNVGPTLSIYRGEKASMGVRILTPDGAKTFVRDGHLTYATFNPKAPAAPPPQPGILDIHSATPERETRFLIALVPGRSAASVKETAGAMKVVAGDGCIGLRSGGDLVLFRTGADGSEARCAGTAADAAAWTLTEDGGSLKLLAAESARLIERAGRKLMESDGAVNFAAQYESGNIDLAVSEKKPAQLKIFTGRKPASVLLDKTALKTAYNSDDETATFSIPAGEHVIHMHTTD